MLAGLGCGGAASVPQAPAVAAASCPSSAPAAPSASSAPASSAPPAPAVPEHPLHRINSDFHIQYAAARAREQATLGATRPYLFVGGRKIVLRYQGKTTEVSLVSERFDALKHASHAPITAVSAILAQDDAKTLADLAGRFRDADALIGPAPFAETVTAAHAVVRASIALLEAAQRKLPTEAELHTFGVKTRPDTTTLLQAACDDALVHLDAAVRELRPLTGDAWGQAVVVLTTDHQSRAQEAETQYFQHLFKEHAGEGAFGEARIVIDEAIGPNDGPEQAMASHLYDRHLSDLLFDEPEFLQGDVLGKNAAATIARLLAKPL